MDTNSKFSEMGMQALRCLRIHIHTPSNSLIFCISSYLRISISLALRHPLLTILFLVLGKPTQDTSWMHPAESFYFASWRGMHNRPGARPNLQHCQPSARTELNDLGQNHCQYKRWLSVFYGSDSSTTEFRDTRLNKSYTQCWHSPNHVSLVHFWSFVKAFRFGDEGPMALHSLYLPTSCHSCPAYTAFFLLRPPNAQGSFLKYPSLDTKS